jgi:hypothetical protein
MDPLVKGYVERERSKASGDRRAFKPTHRVRDMYYPTTSHLVWEARTRYLLKWDPYGQYQAQTRTSQGDATQPSG